MRLLLTMKCNTIWGLGTVYHLFLGKERMNESVVSDGGKGKSREKIK